MDPVTLALLVLVGRPTLVFAVAVIVVGPIMFAFRGKAPLLDRLLVAFVGVATVATAVFVSLSCD